MPSLCTGLKRQQRFRKSAALGVLQVHQNRENLRSPGDFPLHSVAQLIRLSLALEPLRQDRRGHHSSRGVTQISYRAEVYLQGQNLALCQGRSLALLLFLARNVTTRL